MDGRGRGNKEEKKLKILVVSLLPGNMTHSRCDAQLHNKLQLPRFSVKKRQPSG